MSKGWAASGSSRLTCRPPLHQQKALTVPVTCPPWKFHQIPSLGTAAVSYVGHTVKEHGGFPWLAEEGQLLKGSELGMRPGVSPSWGAGLQDSSEQRGGGPLGPRITSFSLGWLSSVAQCTGNGSRLIAVAKVALGIPCDRSGSVWAPALSCSTLKHSTGHVLSSLPRGLGQGGAHLQVVSSNSCLWFTSARRLR